MDSIGDNVIPGQRKVTMGLSSGRPDTSGGTDSLEDSIAYGLHQGSRSCKDSPAKTQSDGG